MVGLRLVPNYERAARIIGLDMILAYNWEKFLKTLTIFHFFRKIAIEPKSFYFLTSYNRAKNVAQHVLRENFTLKDIF